ncbi:MAG: aspartate carbamoyltransferase regulatory subunit [Bacteroidales bacterium]|jgi:aspartate carbamoyltransferase regulatory subunit|nr:aspartate carbamoyltransferase regulatory subunit [Bacteroidales bacterium]MDD4087579.1 aspartate carbamoyltransferase regulatory subunit [Bacteroidales bacterium]MDY0086291.1 aspartate carbamoyltransferase regulatory subunit [Bacteroidales bacterium]
MNTKRKELIVSAISNGTVIDHIPADKVFQVIRILDLEESEKEIYFGTNLVSKKYGRKGIIKISEKYFKPSETDKIALVAPTATLIEIRDYEVTRKTTVNIPDSIERIAKCFNPNCITNKEQVPTKFKVIKIDGEIKLACHYCEKNTSQNNMVFI